MVLQELGPGEADESSEEDPNDFDPSAIPSPHAGEDVAVYAIGFGAGRVHGTLEQHSLFDIIFEAIL